MQPKLLFVYGILKRNFSLDLTKKGASFMGPDALPGAQLFQMGGGVGLRLDESFRDCPLAQGEVFEIPDSLWRWLDSIEQNGFCYTRRVVETKFGPAWVYEHTFPGTQYRMPIPANDYQENSPYARG